MSLLTRTFILATSLLAGLTLNQPPASAQTPDDATDGVILVETLAGATAGAKIDSCIQIFAAGNDPAGVCDARGLAGGVIDSRIRINVEGLTVLLGSETFTITGEGGFRLAADRTTLEGQGDATVLDASTRTGLSAVLDLWNPNGPRVDGPTARYLKITGVHAGTSGLGFSLARAVRTSNATIQGLTFEDTDQTAVNVSDSVDTLVEGCTITEATNYGILVRGSSERVRVLNNVISRAGLGAGNGVIGLGAIAIFGDADDAPAPSGVLVEGNRVDNYGGGGVRVTRRGLSIPEHIRIIGNYIDGIAPDVINSAEPRATPDGEGIGVSGNHIEILNNRVDKAYVNGIAVFLDQAAGTIEDITIAQNRVSNSSQMPGGGNIHNGVGLIIRSGHASNITIGDNVLFDDQPIATQGYAVSLNPNQRPPKDAISNFFVHDNVSSRNRFSPSLSPEVFVAGVLLGNSP